MINFEIKLTADHYFDIFFNYCLDMNKIGLIEAKFIFKNKCLNAQNLQSYYGSSSPLGFVSTEYTIQGDVPCREIGQMGQILWHN